MSDKYLSIENVSKSFSRGEDTTEVLQDISLKRRQRRVHLPHRSLRLRQVDAAQHRRRADAGDTKAACSWRIARCIGPGPDRAVVFQNHSLLPWLTVYQNVRLAVDKVFRGTKSAAERHEWTLHNLRARAHGRCAARSGPHEISGGMKQRVGIARAIAMSPKVLLLDEPFGALDALTRAHLQDQVMQIHATLGQHGADDHARRRRSRAARPTAS